MSIPPAKHNAPDPLAMYREAVQHPLAEIDFAQRAYAHYFMKNQPNLRPTRLREDFAGTCAVAALWAMADPARTAFAVEADAATIQWAAIHTLQTSGTAKDRVQLICDDVMKVDEPKADITLATNFSTLIYHAREDLLAYMRHAYATLASQGIFICDLFGGPGSEKVGMQVRRILPDDFSLDPFDYCWDQQRFDPATRRIDCRIHFKPDNQPLIRDAFCYDWTLWPAQGMLDVMDEAGFDEVALWWAPPGEIYKPIAQSPDGHDWVAYLVGVKRS